MKTVLLKLEVCPHCGAKDLKPYAHFYCCYTCGELINRKHYEKITGNYSS